MKDLIAVLSSWGKLSPEQVEQARVASASTNKTQRQILIDMGITDEDLLIKAEAEVWGIPFFDQQNFVVSTELLNMVPKSVAESYLFIPIDLSKEKQLLSVVMAKPQDLTAIDFLEKKTGMKLKIYASTPDWIKLTIDRNYSTGLIGDISDVLKRGGSEDEDSVGVVTAESMAAIIKEPKIVEIVKKVLEYAIRLRASDVHIEPSENDTRIRYRVDGILEEKLRLERQYHAALVSRIKILSNIKIDEKRIPQDGRFNFKSDDGEVDLRISTLPTVHGEKVVMRLLRKNSKVPTLPDLGLRGKALKNLEESVNIPHGIILITGPTGSVKHYSLFVAG
jgi:type IV pilus assembly protein PilB